MADAPNKNPWQPSWISWATNVRVSEPMRAAAAQALPMRPDSRIVGPGIYQVVIHDDRTASLRLLSKDPTA